MVVAGLKITMTVTAMRREVQLVACKVDQELPVGEEEVLPADQELLVATAEVIKGNRLSIKNQEEAHANPVSTDVKKNSKSQGKILATSQYFISVCSDVNMG